MKKTIARISKWAIGVVPALAMMIAVQSVSSTCCFVLHQPDVPEELER